MKEIKDIAANYAAGKATEVIDKAIAQAYADGYRDGYKDCEEEIPVDLRDNKTEYIDLGLPSGLLWSADYEKRGDDYLYLPYIQLVNLTIPTQEQWDELINECEWLEVADTYVCLGPNGNHISFKKAGFIKIEPQKINGDEASFWIANTKEKGNYRNAGNIYFRNEIKKNTFSYYKGIKMPIRLVKMK